MRTTTTVMSTPELKFAHLTSLEEICEAVGFDEDVITSQLLQIVDESVLDALRDARPNVDRPKLRLIKS